MSGRTPLPRRRVESRGMLALGLALGLGGSLAPAQTPVEPRPGITPLEVPARLSEEVLPAPGEAPAVIREAARVLSDESAGRAEIAGARYALARHAYSDAVLMLNAPPPPMSGEGNPMLRRYEYVHRMALVAQRALSDLDQVPEAGLGFLRSHATRMGAAARQGIASGAPMGISSVDVIKLQLMALEARSWVLEAEPDGDEAPDATNPRSEGTDQKTGPG